MKSISKPKVIRIATILKNSGTQKSKLNIKFKNPVEFHIEILLDFILSIFYRDSTQRIFDTYIYIYNILYFIYLFSIINNISSIINYLII